MTHYHYHYHYHYGQQYMLNRLRLLKITKIRSFYSAQSHFEAHQLNNTKYTKKMCEAAFWRHTSATYVALVALT